ncbi:MAG TPA: ATPase [Marinilabiliales bacterium]|nr:MAG: ATPase [Bacteroidetes bacterium GWA2_40_14]OFX57564.1 MAG: ATPase [Bacteroidetes bacterium GWC2_40_13]OFX73235.1 MAG: ATPase [Bacteroidetes bacterium GWD2_40_43]OFX92090.1 MAG: ATPase [Bacteroidetes bacterium GWE2_40_63]OFY16714.1 MAG: ATPase [Bacteroidetes bacterium GWF2_40_13]OFZ30610.1 MAG: ATPase [Bacteroidetes bacterium RIFOXYC2_FULL_40_12]HAM98933.1 ATPase [Marinilabiliales bacterium]
MINRELYLKKLKEFIDKPFIKVISGIRRSGKSALLILLKEELLKRGINEKNIIYVNFESFEHSEILKAKELYAYVKDKIQNKGKYYILLDEIQEVEAWEKAINSFAVDFNADIYITGSNSKLLSGELATYLAGRYVEFLIYTLSFNEMLMFKAEQQQAQSTIYNNFELFLRMGGFPAIHTSTYTSESAYQIVHDIYSSVILRDVVQRNKIRDVELLERVVKYVFDNIGNKFSAKNVADYFKSQNRKLDLNTVYNYLNALERAFIIYRIPRFDIKGKEILKTNEKYFIGDQSLLYALMGYKGRLISGILENIVMLELKRRGYQVYVGKLDNAEVDFIAEQGNKKIYIQVCYKMTEKSTIEREYKPLLSIKDNYPKYVLTMDEHWNDNIEGIEHRHIADFLLMEGY